MNYPKITLILSIILVFNTGASLALAQFAITNINVNQIQNGHAAINWETQLEPTKAVVYWGENTDSLNNYFIYPEFDYIHQSTINGLQKNTIYYYKIIAFNQNYHNIESFLQTFSTKDMIDTIQPEFTDKQILQITNNAVAASWTTNEATKAEINYGKDIYNLDKKASYGNYNNYHELFLYDLGRDYEYYIKIIAEDRDQNKQITTINFRVENYLINKDYLEINNIEPLVYNSDLITDTSATINWNTNLVAKSKIHYGTKSDHYDYHIDVNRDQRSLKHTITLTKLEPYTTYYYKLEAYDSLYNKRAETNELTFTTGQYSALINLPLPVQINFTDTDQDKLSDGFETEIGTNPLYPDTDGDGYEDGHEMRYGYDPLIPGSSLETKLQPERYFRPKLSDQLELQKQQELNLFLSIELKTDFRTSSQNWRALSNAYIYGQYPLKSILQAVKFGGKTVHPTINWTAWKNSEQYQEYINL